MKFKIVKVCDADPGYFDDRVWASLRVSPHTLLSQRQIHASLAPIAQQMGDECTPVLCLNIDRTYEPVNVGQRLSSLVLSASEIDLCETEQVALVILRIEVSHEAWIARQLRTRELSFGAASRFGCRLPNKGGRRDQLVPPFVSQPREPAEEAVIGRRLRLLAKHTAHSKWLYDRLMYNNDTTLAMLLKELVVREQLADERDGAVALGPLATRKDEKGRRYRDQMSESNPSDDESSESPLAFCGDESAVTLGSTDTETERESNSNFLAGSLIASSVADQLSASDDDDDESTDATSVNLDGAASSDSDEDDVSETAILMSEDVVVEELPPVSIVRAVPVQIYRIDELDWLRTALQQGEAKAEFVNLTKINRTTLLERARRARVPLLSDNLVHHNAFVVDTFDNDPEMLFTTLPALLYTEDTEETPPESLDPPDVYQAAEQEIVLPKVTEDAEIALPVQEKPRVTEQWLEDLELLDLDKITVYEFSAYAKARITVYAALLHNLYVEEADLPIETHQRKNLQYWLDFYPRRISVEHNLLRLMDAHHRLSKHESIGLMALCLASADDEFLRDSLFLGEALLVEYHHTAAKEQYAVLDDYNTTDPDQSREELSIAIDARSTTIEQFCSRIRMDAADDQLTEAIEDLASTWHKTMADLRKDWVPLEERE